MENIKRSISVKKLLPIILAALAIIIVVIIVVVGLKRGAGKAVGVIGGDEIRELKISENGVKVAESDFSTEEGLAGTEEFEELEELREASQDLVDAVREVPGTNLISTGGQVITDEGFEIRTDVSVMNAKAPRSSLPISKEEVQGKAIMLDVSAIGFSPNIFTVKRGEAITIALSSTDQWGHNIQFSDPSLQSAETSVTAGTTRAFSFNAPNIAGEYNFSCTIPGHAFRGEVGKMIVE